MASRAVTNTPNKAEAAKIKDDQGRPMTWDHMKSRKRRPIRTLSIPLDDEMAAEWQDVLGRYDLAKLRIEVGIDNPELLRQTVEEMAEAQARKDALLEEMKDNVAVFRIQGLGRKKYEALQNEPQFQPTKEQQELNRRRNGQSSTLPWNVDTFPPALISACMLEPELSIAEAKELWSSDDWTTAELLTILNTCIEVNEQVRNIDWGKD